MLLASPVADGVSSKAVTLRHLRRDGVDDLDAIADVVVEGIKGHASPVLVEGHETVTNEAVVVDGFQRLAGIRDAVPSLSTSSGPQLVSSPRQMVVTV